MIYIAREKREHKSLSKSGEPMITRYVVADALILWASALQLSQGCFTHCRAVVLCLVLYANMGPRNAEKLAASCLVQPYFWTSTSSKPLQKKNKVHWNTEHQKAWRKQQKLLLECRVSRNIKKNLNFRSWCRYHGCRLWMCLREPLLRKKSREYRPERAISTGIGPKSSMMCAKWSRRKEKKYDNHSLHTCVQRGTFISCGVPSSRV